MKIGHNYVRLDAIDFLEITSSLHGLERRGNVTIHLRYGKSFAWFEQDKPLEFVADQAERLAKLCNIGIEGIQTP